MSAVVNKVARVYLSLGSNIRRYHHIARALDELDQRFAPLLISPVFLSEAIGFEGDDFLNLVVGLDTTLSIAELSTQMRAIEDANGRRRDGPRFSSRSLDIDLLTYDNVAGDFDGVRLPREEILYNAFVLKPMALLAPEDIHPLANTSYARLWADYDQDSQRLEQVDFEWRGGWISRAEG